MDTTELSSETFVSIFGFSEMHSSMIPLSRPTHARVLCYLSKGRIYFHAFSYQLQCHSVLHRQRDFYFLCSQDDRFYWSSISLWIQVELSIINQDYLFQIFIHYLLGSLESLSHNAHPIFGSRKNQSYYYRLQATASIPSDFWSYFVKDLPLAFSARSFVARSFAERKTPSNHPHSISMASHLVSEFWS